MKTPKKDLNQTAKFVVDIAVGDIPNIEEVKPIENTKQKTRSTKKHQG